MPLHTGTDRLHLALLNADHRVIDHTWNWQVRSTFWRFYVNSAAGAAIRLGQAWSELAPHRVHLLPPWIIFDCRCVGTVNHFYAHFEVIGLPKPLVREVFARPITLRPERDLEARAASCAHAIRTTTTQPPEVACELTAVLYSAMAKACSSLPLPQRERLRAALSGNPELQPALSAIRERYRQPLSNAWLARSCGMSVDHFIKIFRSSIGQTPAQYILELRLSQAAQKLITTDDSIDAIADGCGFPNRYYLSRVFAMRMGSPPAEYRKRAGR